MPGKRVERGFLGTEGVDRKQGAGEESRTPLVFVLELQYLFYVKKKKNTWFFKKQTDRILKLKRRHRGMSVQGRHGQVTENNPGSCKIRQRSYEEGHQDPAEQLRVSCLCCQCCGNPRSCMSRDKTLKERGKTLKVERLGRLGGSVG